MNQTTKYTLVVTVALGLGAVGGFFYGAKVGVEQFALLESSAKAFLLADELRSLRRGNTERLIPLKELYLDSEVLRFGEFRQKGHPWIFWLAGPPEREHAKWMRGVAAYRKEHPPFSPTLAEPKGGELASNKKHFDQELLQVTNEILKEYGQ